MSKMSREEIEYGIKELVTGLLIGLVLGLIIGLSAKGCIF